MAAVWEREHGRGGVLLAGVPERRHAALVDALRRRFARLEPVPGDPAAGRDAVRTLLDGGATLVCGGTADSAGFRPSLFAHLRLSAALAEALGRPAPVLALAPREPQAAAWQALLARYDCLTWQSHPDRR